MGESNNKNGQKELIKELKERLHWYTYEASSEEFDEAVVIDIVNLLNKLEPLQEDEYFNPEKGLERFWKYCERREAGENAGLNELKNREDSILAEALRGAEITEAYTHAAGSCSAEHAARKNVGENITDFAKAAESRAKASTTDNAGKKKGRLLLFGKHKGLVGTCAAAILVLMVSAVGVGASASKNTGLFHWLSKDETGREVIVTTNLDKDKATITTYDSFEKLPEDYCDIIIDMDWLYQDLELSYIETAEANTYSKVASYYKNEDHNLHLEIETKKYISKLSIERVTVDSYHDLGTKDFFGVSVDRYEKISDDETEYLLYFTYDSMQCSIWGNTTLEKLEKIVNEYVRLFTANQNIEG